MPLDHDALTAALQTTFKDAKANEWSSDQVAEALADAIDAFVKSGDVTDVTVDVVDAGDNPIGTGSQTGTGHIE